MQLHSESNPALNTVTAYGPDYIDINEVSYKHAVYFSPEGEIHTLNATSIADFDAELLRTIAGLKAAAPDPMDFLNEGSVPKKPLDAPEVVLIGTGLRQHFLPPHVAQTLLTLGIGLETMNTQAAARTYNILMAEGRRVVAALLPTQETT